MAGGGLRGLLLLARPQQSRPSHSILPSCIHPYERAIVLPKAFCHPAHTPPITDSAQIAPTSRKRGAEPTPTGATQSTHSHILSSRSISATTASKAQDSQSSVTQVAQAHTAAEQAWRSHSGRPDGPSAAQQTRSPQRAEKRRKQPVLPRPLFGLARIEEALQSRTVRRKLRCTNHKTNKCAPLTDVAQRGSGANRIRKRDGTDADASTVNVLRTPGFFCLCGDEPLSLCTMAGL